MLEHFLQAVAALIAIANPVGAVPVFRGMTATLDPGQQRRVALRTTLYVALILLVAALEGRWLLSLLGITDAAFQAGGGLVILLMGLEMMRGRPARVQHEAGSDADDDPALVPLAMPIIAGPGAITVVITLTAHERSLSGQLSVLGAVLCLALALLTALFFARWLHNRIGRRGHRVLLRFLGLVLVVLGAQLMLSGIRIFLVH